MHAVEPVSLVYQSKAKNYIQALLKTRNKQHRIPSRISRKYSLRNTDHFSGGFAIESQDSNFLVDDQHSEFTHQDSPPENVENLSDFNYSQKLFHIADGNLYSIFSPIQGRSYGMKPSFLRKQKYTVQECHSRGRKNLRKGLKFHNFLPSESVTSEKDNGFLKSKWKVHSECRLREEHGTKQITISNWSQSVQNSTEDPLLQNPVNNSHSALMKFDSSTKEPVLSTDNEYRIQIKQKPCDSDPYDFKINLEKIPQKKPKASTMTESKEHDLIKSDPLKKGSLKCVLDSLLDKPTIVENQNYYLQDPKSTQNQKHRRKPVQTRRVVPYTKYLSILEEDESSPLDLSSKCSDEKSISPLSFDDESFSSRKSVSNCDDASMTDRHNILVKDHFNLKSLSNSKLNLVSCNRTSDNFVDSPIAHLLQNQLSSPLVLVSSPISNNLNVGQFPNDNKILQETEALNGKPNFNFHMNRIKITNSSPPLHINPGPSFSGNMQYAVQKSFVKNSQPKIRRRSQRSVIKKNLEDTFRQNGFLVKTKQVSDGEATFCKFRQLRKYTRYYLKSWQQHLPDEVHKMWKGFLPPKTVLPPVSGSTEATNEKH